jgi:hypothetical protein
MGEGKVPQSRERRVPATSCGYAHGSLCMHRLQLVRIEGGMPGLLQGMSRIITRHSQISTASLLTASSFQYVNTFESSRCLP